MSNTNVDFSVLRANLNATKPPYKCPIKDCEKIYRSFNGMQQHFDDHEDRLQKNNRKKGRNMDINPLKAKKKIVEVELGGQLIQFDLSTPMKLVSTENGKKPSCITVLKTGKMTSQKNHSHSFEKSDVGIPTSSLPEPKFKILDAYVRRPALKRNCSSDPKSFPPDEIVLYDADEEDLAWLELMNEDRAKENLPALTRDTFERVFDKFESSCHFEHRADERSGRAPTTRDEDAICSVCQDGECLNTNVILFCDLCNLPVHQECYGVPHVPEGPWICRRCLLSPSKAVDCCLCPSKIGAMKQTDDGKWAHIVCALWIPDAGFANSVFLEPIDGIERISPARWKLTCHVCRRRSAGACIQCHKVSCYTAFHVTCAQQAGLHMKIESSNSAPFPEQDDHHHHQQGNSNTSQEHLAKFSIAQSNWSKKVYCDFHTPSGETSSNENDGRFSETEDGRSTGQVAPPTKAAMRRARNLVAEGREVLPLLSFPSLDSKRYDLIRESLQLDDRDEVIEKLKNYWLLKRRSRNGVPLVTYPNSYCLKKAEESLQVNMEEKVAEEVNRDDDDDDDDDDNDDDDDDDDDDHHLSEEDSTMGSKVDDDDNELDERKKEFRQMKKLRQELERVRLLNELIRKRERVKMKLLDHDELLLQCKLNPVRALFDIINSTSEDKGLSSLLNDDNDDIDGGADDDDGADDANDADDTDDTSMSRPQNALKMSDIVRKVEALEYDSVREFEADFERFCDSKRAKVNSRRKGKVTTLKRMGLRIIRRYATAVSSLAATTVVKTTNNSNSDDSSDISVDTQIHEPKQEQNQVTDGDTDPPSVATESCDAHKTLIPSSFVPPLPMSAAVPLSSAQFLTSSPTATVSSRLQATASSSVHPSQLMRPPKKRDHHGYGVFGSSPRDPKFQGVDPSSSRLDENDNLRLLAETADSISSENSYTVDPNPDNNSSSLTGSVNSRHPEESGRSHYLALPETNQPQSSTQMNDQSRTTTTATVPPNLNDSQLKTIEACDSTTDWPNVEEAESSSKRKMANQNHQTGRKRQISRSSKNSLDVKNHKRTRSTSNNEDVGDDNKAGVDDDDNDNDDDESSKVKLKTSEESGVVRRETRRKSIDTRDLEEFLVSLSHGDFVWAQYGKYPSYPAIIVSPSSLKHESNSITRGRSARGQEGLVGVHQDDVIPVPAPDVVKANSDKEKYLVCFFDQKRTWQWVSRSKLDPLGVDSGLDKKKMSEVKRTVTKKTIVEAYKKALKQRCVRYRENYARSLAAVLNQ